MVQLSQAYVEWEERTKQEGAEREARSLPLRLLSRSVGEWKPIRARTDRVPLDFTYAALRQN